MPADSPNAIDDGTEEFTSELLTEVVTDLMSSDGDGGIQPFTPGQTKRLVALRSLYAGSRVKRDALGALVGAEFGQKGDPTLVTRPGVPSFDGPHRFYRVLHGLAQMPTILHFMFERQEVDARVRMIEIITNMESLKAAPAVALNTVPPEDLDEKISDVEASITFYGASKASGVLVQQFNSDAQVRNIKAEVARILRTRLQLALIKEGVRAVVGAPAEWIRDVNVRNPGKLSRRGVVALMLHFIGNGRSVSTVGINMVDGKGGASSVLTAVLDKLQENVKITGASPDTVALVPEDILRYDDAGRNAEHNRQAFSKAWSAGRTTEELRLEATTIQAIISDPRCEFSQLMAEEINGDQGGGKFVSVLTAEHVPPVFFAPPGEAGGDTTKPQPLNIHYREFKDVSAVGTDNRASAVIGCVSLAKLALGMICWDNAGAIRDNFNVAPYVHLLAGLSGVESGPDDDVSTATYEAGTVVQSSHIDPLIGTFVGGRGAGTDAGIFYGTASSFGAVSSNALDLPSYMENAGAAMRSLMSSLDASDRAAFEFLVRAAMRNASCDVGDHATAVAFLVAATKASAKAALDANLDAGVSTSIGQGGQVVPDVDIGQDAWITAEDCVFPGFCSAGTLASLGAFPTKGWGEGKWKNDGNTYLKDAVFAYCAAIRRGLRVASAIVSKLGGTSGSVLSGSVSKNLIASGEMPAPGLAFRSTTNPLTGEPLTMARIDAVIGAFVPNRSTVWVSPDGNVVPGTGVEVKLGGADADAGKKLIYYMEFVGYNWVSELKDAEAWYTVLATLNLGERPDASVCAAFALAIATATGPPADDAFARSSYNVAFATVKRWEEYVTTCSNLAKRVEGEVSVEEKGTIKNFVVPSGLVYAVFATHFSGVAEKSAVLERYKKGQASFAHTNLLVDDAFLRFPVTNPAFAVGHPCAPSSVPLVGNGNVDYSKLVVDAGKDREWMFGVKSPSLVAMLTARRNSPHADALGRSLGYRRRCAVAALNGQEDLTAAILYGVRPLTSGGISAAARDGVIPPILPLVVKFRERLVGKPSICTTSHVGVDHRAIPVGLNSIKPSTNDNGDVKALVDMMHHFTMHTGESSAPSREDRGMIGTEWITNSGETHTSAIVGSAHSIVNPAGMALLPVADFSGVRNTELVVTREITAAHFNRQNPARGNCVVLYVGASRAIDSAKTFRLGQMVKGEAQSFPGLYLGIPLTGVDAAARQTDSNMPANLGTAGAVSVYDLLRKDYVPLESCSAPILCKSGGYENVGSFSIQPVGEEGPLTHIKPERGTGPVPCPVTYV